MQRRLLQHQIRRRVLLVRRITVSLEHAFHEATEIGLNALANGPVDRHVVLDGSHELACDLPQRLVAEDGDRAVVRLQKRKLIVGAGGANPAAGGLGA